MLLLLYDSLEKVLCLNESTRKLSLTCFKYCLTQVDTVDPKDHPRGIFDLLSVGKVVKGPRP